jgi:hypothetical protein
MDNEIIAFATIGYLNAKSSRRKQTIAGKNPGFRKGSK